MTTNEYGIAYERGFQQTLRSLRACGLNHTRAEECAQSAWCRGYEYLYQLRDPGSVVSWVTATAFNLLRSDQKRTKLFSELLPAHDRISSSTINQAAADLGRILRFCKPHQRTLLEGRYLVGLSAVDMARLLGTSAGAIDHRVMRALDAIRRAIGYQTGRIQKGQKNAPNGNGN
jgi:DNA-directed RNA polymerase specialized sigma24 family protein